MAKGKGTAAKTKGPPPRRPNDGQYHRTRANKLRNISWELARLRGLPRTEGREAQLRVLEQALQFWGAGGRR